MAEEIGERQLEVLHPLDVENLLRDGTLTQVTSSQGQFLRLPMMRCNAKEVRKLGHNPANFLGQDPEDFDLPADTLVTISKYAISPETLVQIGFDEATTPTIRDDWRRHSMNQGGSLEKGLRVFLDWICAHIRATIGVDHSSKTDEGWAATMGAVGFDPDGPAGWLFRPFEWRDWSSCSCWIFNHVVVYLADLEVYQEQSKRRVLDTVNPGHASMKHWKLHLDDLPKHDTMLGGRDFPAVDVQRESRGWDKAEARKWRYRSDS